jgi:hypothetical protein
VAAAAVVTTSADGAQLALSAVCGLLLVLRSRERTGSAEVVPLAVAGQLTVLAAGAGLALAHPHQVGPLVVLVAGAAVLLGAAVLPSTAVDRPRWVQRRRRLEVLALVSLVPLLGGVLGLFGAVVRLARGAE